MKKALADDNITCTLPWIQSMIPEVDPVATDAEICRGVWRGSNDLQHGIEIAGSASAYNNPNCPGKKLFEE